MICPICGESELYYLEKAINKHFIDHIIPEYRYVELGSPVESFGEDEPLPLCFYCEKCGGLDAETVYERLEELDE